MKLLSIVQYLSLLISSSLTSRTKGHPLSTLRTKKDRRSLQTDETMTGAVISSPGFKTCTLEAKLGYPFKDPDEAPYKGFHASWLLVNKVSDDKMALDICDGGYNADVAWCTYNNTGGWDGAYIGNVDDYYPSWASEEDSLIDEIFTIEGSANSAFEMYVSHWFFEKDYNTEYSEWSDHMFAPVLTVKNIAKDIMVMEKGCTTTNWTHPVDMNVKTHVKDEKGAWVKNTEYKGDFKVTVTCDEDCVCVTSDYSLFDNLYEKLLGIELTSLQADTICHLNKQ